ncbi:MAG: 5-formyltetrahydrofolate cyclo-ligase [Clostridia bacterium]|nr:5-formyltetrahydrofolate cyclo-ligase [Clostridia bacterium]
MREDIRQVKSALRQQMKDIRRGMTPAQKVSADQIIRDTFLHSTSYTRSSVILTYVSTAIEVDTREIIRVALSEGKRVACPRCIDGTRQMAFYYIESLEELTPCTFGVPEPEALPQRLYQGSSHPICIVPGLAFDRWGYRLGYGKGYYDRFLSGYRGWTVGLCYSDCVEYKLPHGHYDRAVDRLITEKYLRRCAEGRSVRRKSM